MPAKDVTKFAAVFGMAAFLCAAIAACIEWICNWRNFRRLLLGLACFITLVALLYVEEDLRGKWAWNRFKTQWGAKGQKFDLVSFAPPSVPDEQNFALTPIMFSTYGSMIDTTGHEINPRNTNVVNRLNPNIYRNNEYTMSQTNGNWALSTLTDLQSWQGYYRVATNAQGILTNEFPVSPHAQTPAKDVLLALSKYDSMLEELRQASRRPYSRFPLEYDKEDPAAILLPHLAYLKTSSELLRLRAIAEVQDGKMDAAMADITLMCYLTHAPDQEPFLVSHLVRIVMLNFTIQPLYEGLVEHKWSDAQLVGVDAELAKINLLADYQRSMKSEAAASASIIGYIEHTREVSPFLQMFAQGNPQSRFSKLDFICRVVPSGWFYQNQIRICGFYLQQCAPAVNPEQRQVSPKAAEQAQASLEAATARLKPYNALQYMFFQPVKQWSFEHNISVDKFAHAQTAIDLARVAIALERYRIAHGDYPETLAPLTPQFIGTLPHDVINGQPLHYRRSAGSEFVLYSVGWNEVDDSGAVVPTAGTTPTVDITKGDWVWKYPEKTGK